MERRRGQRIKRRLPCEFLHEGHRYRGIVVDLSAGGLFLQTDTALDPGTELEVHLSGARFPELSLRAVVARRRFTPAILATMIRRGVGLRIVQAPPQYYEALGRASEASPEDDPFALEGEVEVEILVSETPPAAGEAPAPTEAEASPVAPPVEASVAASEAPPAQSPLPEPGDPPAGQAQGGWISRSSLPSEALVIDEGELDDVHDCLIELGANPLRHVRAELAAFRGWAEPPRVFVASARSALRLELPSAAASQGVISIAVAEADSQTLCRMLSRQGFQYVVRRPVHREALRLLLLRALYRDRERRSASRLPFGYPIRWRRGLRRHEGILVEISADGARLLARDSAEPGGGVSLRLPREVADGAPLRLRGRVLRCERRRAVPPEVRVALALRFEGLSRRTRERLALVLAERSTGPATLARDAKPAAPANAGPPRTAEREPAAARANRRRHPRVALRQEVLALDERAERVRYVLLGRDLSAGGLRVEPHPDLTVGHRVRLALYDPSRPEALLVDAEVARDDGEHGLALRFLGAQRGAARQLEALARAAQSVEFQGADAPAHAVVVAELLAEPPRP